MNIIDYVKTKMEDFNASGFNMVDSLVLSQFVYLNFDKVVPGFTDKQTPVRIADLLMAEHITGMIKNVRCPKKNQVTSGTVFEKLTKTFKDSRKT